VTQGVCGRWSRFPERGGCRSFAARWRSCSACSPFYPVLTAFVLLVYVAAWAVVLGGLQVYGAIRLRREISFEWWLALGGIASVVFGILLMLRPVQGAVAALWVIAGYSVGWGVMLMLGGLSMRARASVTRAA
jgi:uncharacterized membrane protein HdeD (DUF308 family)